LDHHLKGEPLAVTTYDREYHLSAPQKYALEKWRAVAVHETFEAYGIDVGPEAVAGMESNTLYLNPESRNFKGLDKVTGQAVEVMATQVAGKKLSTVLQFADEIVRQRRQLLQQATEAPYTETTTSAAPGTSGASPQTSDSQVKVDMEELAVEVTVKEECAASPKEDLIVKLRVDKEAFNALLDEKAPPAKKRRLVESSRSRELGAPGKHLIVKLRVDKEAFNALLNEKAPPAKKRRLVETSQSRELGTKHFYDPSAQSFQELAAILHTEFDQDHNTITST